MDFPRSPKPDRYAATLQRLLEIPSADLEVALSHAADAIADALDADKVDAFLYDPTRDSLVAVGTSNQPLSALQRSLGLDVLPLSNGGRVVHVFRTGTTFVTGQLQHDAEELRGIKEGLQIRSKVGVPLDIAGERRGMMMIASQQPDFFSERDAQFAETAVRWIATVAHRAELVREIEKNAIEQARISVAEELMTVLAHDLRNDLAPIVLRLHRIRRRAQESDDDATMEDSAKALRAMTQVSRLIDNILDVARLDTGLFELDPIPVEIVQLVEEAAKALESPAHEIVISAGEPIFVIGDENRLRQVMNNLFTNAIRHSPGEAPVSVFISKRIEGGQEWAQVDVMDEGPGVPEELRNRIFDRFVSGQPGRGGLGLGLYVSRRILMAHGGDLTVNKEIGQGARFTLKLPCPEDIP